VSRKKLLKSLLQTGFPTTAFGNDNEENIIHDKKDSGSQIFLTFAF
jgi:hypothetical protein